MVGEDANGYLNVSSGRKITRGGLQEEEWFLWTSTVEFLDMFGVISADGDDLERPPVML